jgi:hypothetical protein
MEPVISGCFPCECKSRQPHPVAGWRSSFATSGQPVDQQPGLDGFAGDGQMATNANRPGYKLIFTAYITTKQGRRIYAWQKGLKVFAIWVKA